MRLWDYTCKQHTKAVKADALVASFVDFLHADGANLAIAILVLGHASRSVGCRCRVVEYA